MGGGGHGGGGDGVSEAPLKWIFAINGESDAYDEMTMVAVRSALRATELVPVCIYYGPTSPPPPLYRWLEARGVRIVRHAPAWTARLERAMLAAREKGNGALSPLYNRTSAMIGTFLRVDIPVLGFVDEVGLGE